MKILYLYSLLQTHASSIHEYSNLLLNKPTLEHLTFLDIIVEEYQKEISSTQNEMTSSMLSHKFLNLYDIYIMNSVQKSWLEYLSNLTLNEPFLLNSRNSFNIEEYLDETFLLIESAYLIPSPKGTQFPRIEKYIGLIDSILISYAYVKYRIITGVQKQIDESLVEYKTKDGIFRRQYFIDHLKNHSISLQKFFGFFQVNFHKYIANKNVSPISLSNLMSYFFPTEEIKINFFQICYKRRLLRHKFFKEIIDEYSSSESRFMID